MRYGWNDELAKYVESVPQRARPIVETVITTAADIKDRESDYSGADATAAFTLFDDGGVRLIGSGTSALAANTTRVAGADLTNLQPPTGSALGCAVVELGYTTVVGQQTEIFGATAYLDPKTSGSGQEVTHWYANLYRFDGVSIDSGQEAWSLQPIASDSVAAATSPGDVTFTFAKGQGFPAFGDPPDLEGASVASGLPAGPSVVLIVWGLKGNGEIASNTSWDCDANNASVASGDHTIYRFDLTALDTTSDVATLRYTAAAASGVPAMSLTANTSYTSATISWTNAGSPSNELDLGAAPSSGTDLEMVLQYSAPSTTTVVAQIRQPDAGSGSPGSWFTFVDGDVIGEDKSGDEGGSDLSTLPRQQTYDLQVALNTTTARTHTPRLFRVGVQEITHEVVDGLMDVNSAGWAIDPITCEGEIPTLDALLHREGEKDYRSWAETLFAENHLNELVFRIWVGHPDLARKYWLKIDDFLVGDYSPGPSGISVRLVSPLQYVLLPIPAHSGGSRTPKEYDGQTLLQVFDDIINVQCAVPTRYRGNALCGSTQGITSVTKTVSVETQAIDVLRQINWLNGSALISSQGVFKTVPLFSDLPLDPQTQAFFEYDDIAVQSTDTGFDRRVTTFEVPYGWDGNKYAGEKQATPGATVLARLGKTAFAQASQLDDGTARWIENTTNATTVGNRIVENFLAGLSQVRFTSSTARPWLEPGDTCVIEQDIYVGIDPRSGRALRGRGWSKAMVTQCHDIMGHEFTVWVPSWFDTIASTTAFTWNSNMTPGGKMLWEFEDGFGEATSALWRAEQGTQAVTISAGAGLTGGGSLAANRTISMSRYGFESLSDPDGGGDKLPFFDDSQDGFQWLTLGTGLSITDTTITATGTNFNAGTGLVETSDTFAVKYTASSNLIDGAADSGDIASADLILYRRDSDGVVRKDTVGALPFTNNSGTVTQVDGGLGLTGSVTGSGAIALDHLGFEDLTDPNGDRIAFWDDSAGKFDWLTAGSGVSISGTTLSATGTVNTAGTGLTLSGSEFSVKYASGSNLIDGAASGTAAGADSILFYDTDGNAVKKDSIANVLDLFSGNVPASRVTAGTFASGNFVFQADLTVDTSTLHVDSSNNRVGIGTTTPTQNLQVEGSSDTYVAVKGHSRFLYLGQDSAGGSVYSTGSVPLNFYVNSALKASIDTSGNFDVVGDVEIGGFRALKKSYHGYSASYETIIVGQAGTTNVCLGVDVSGITAGNFSGSGQVIIPAGGISLVNNADDDYIGFMRRQASSDNIIIGPAMASGMSSGPLTLTTSRVGIGTNDPDCALHLEGSATINARLKFEQTTASKTAQIQQGSSGFAISANGSQSILFDTNGTERLAITTESGGSNVKVTNASLAVAMGTTELTDAGTVTPNWSLSNQWVIDFDSSSSTTTIAVNDTLMTAGGSYILLLQYGGGSSQSLAWTSSATLAWVNGDVPVLSSATAGDITVVQFLKLGDVSNRERIIGSWYQVR